jgi:hypothetical protein
LINRIIIFLLALGFANVFAQETTVLSTNPAASKWYQLKTSGFKILYQRGFEEQAQRMANTMETIREPEARGMNTLPKRIPLVLQSLSSESNAFVTLAPRRSEFYAMPPQNYNFIGGGEWMNMLAVHEYRHIAQYQRSITGFNKLLYYAFGQEAASALAFVTAPQWFWEGDAVATETAFTTGGRGRMPNFDLAFRTNLLEGRKVSYNKQYLRSYKTFVPNHYVLGYHMVSHMRKQTGKVDSWGNIAGRAWSFPLPFAFSRAMKKEAGQYVVPFYNSMMADLKSNYEKELSQLTFTAFENVTYRSNDAYTDYLYPQVLDDGSIVALKSGIGDIEQLVVFDEGKSPKQKFVTGPMNESGMLSVAGQKIVWNEYRFDPRWPVKNFSTVKGFDFKEKLQQQISTKSRYAGAAISPDGEKVLTVETDTSYRTNLVVLDYATGKVLEKIPNSDNAFYSMARWTVDGRTIVSLKSTSKGKAVVSIDYQTVTETDILQPSNENIGHPVLTSNYLLYNSPFSGIDNIYALELSSGKKFQITSAKYGAYNPYVSADGKTLYYNNQGRNGMDVVKIPFDPSQWKPIEQVRVFSFNTYDHLVEQEGHSHILDSISNITYAPKRYHKIARMLNPHSWGAYVNNDLTRVNFGITSKDILSTTQIKAGYDYDVQERTGSWKATVSMQAIYPIVDLTVSHGNRIDNIGSLDFLGINNPGPNADTVIYSRNLTFVWKETTFEGGLRLPLNLTSSKFFQNLSLSNYVGVTQVSNFKNSVNGGGRILPTGPFPGINPPYWFFDTYVDGGRLTFNRFSLFYYSLLKRSSRDINSKWGITINLNAEQTPNQGTYRGKQISFSTYMFLPGLFRHHSLWGYWAFQDSRILYPVETNSSWQSNYVFRNRIPLPRGSSVFRAEKMYSMSANYTMPIWYPDIALGPVLNVKRVRANAFMDYAFANNPERRVVRPDQTSTFTYLSTGVEVKFDINIFRFLPELDLGFRYSYGIQPSASVFEFLLGTFNF